jgi:membrane-bound inhibitor of C-type lysozyme
MRASLSPNSWEENQICKCGDIAYLSLKYVGDGEEMLLEDSVVVLPWGSSGAGYTSTHVVDAFELACGELHRC